MPTRSINTINELIDRAKAHVFSLMMLYGEQLSKGVAIPPSLDRISNLIWACESDYATLEQKNIFADLISLTGDDVVGPDGLFADNVFVNDF